MTYFHFIVLFGILSGVQGFAITLNAEHSTIIRNLKEVSDEIENLKGTINGELMFKHLVPIPELPAKAASIFKQFETLSAVSSSTDLAMVAALTDEELSRITADFLRIDQGIAQIMRETSSFKIPTDDPQSARDLIEVYHLLQDQFLILATTKNTFHNDVLFTRNEVVAGKKISPGDRDFFVLVRPLIQEVLRHLTENYLKLIQIYKGLQ